MMPVKYLVEDGLIDESCHADPDQDAGDQRPFRAVNRPVRVRSLVSRSDSGRGHWISFDCSASTPVGWPPT
jgi:hypothetical protein